MKILVLMKPTPDTETKIKIQEASGKLDMAGVKYVINPYDEFAIEEAIRIKERNQGQGEIVVVTLGGDVAKELFIKALGMGGDRSLLIKNDGLEECDSLTTATVLAAVVRAESPNLVLCGRQGIDDDNMHVGMMVAELLQWPHVNVATKIDIQGTKAQVDREIDGGQIEVHEVSLPAVIGAHKSLNTPRYASLPGIMKAKKKPADIKTPSDFGVDVGQLRSRQRVFAKRVHYPPAKPAGRIFKGEPVEAMVAQVVKLLRDEAKVL